MKKLQIIFAITLIAFMFSCTDDNPVALETDSIELVSVEGTDINVNIGFNTGGETEKIVDFHTTITNKGTRELKLYATMEIIELDTNVTSYFCWGDIDKNEGTCYPPLTVDFTSDRTMTVKAGQTTDKANFLQYVASDLEGGVAKIRYIVFEDGNEANRDTIIYNVSITK